MRPITLTWPASTTNTIATAATATINVPLVLNTNTYMASPATGLQVGVYKMPQNMVRNIVLSASSGSITGETFAVIGLDQNLQPLNETITGATAGVELYYIVLSVTPTSVLTAGVNIGYGNLGTTFLQKMDVYNLNNNYSLSYSIVSGSIALTPYYTTQKIQYFENGVQKNIDTFSDNPSLYYQIPLTNANIIVSPAGSTAIPITTGISISVVGIPLSGLMTFVNSAGSFTQTIIQQGARF